MQSAAGGRAERQGAARQREFHPDTDTSGFAIRFAAHAQAILLQDIAFAGFNVIDLGELHRALRLPAIVIVRRQPDF